MRKFGQELIKAIAGKKIHGIAAIPGGVHKTFFPEERAYFLEENDTPSVDTMIKWSLEMVEFIKNYHEEHAEWLDSFASFPSGHLGLVKKNGALELYDGQLRAIDEHGHKVLNDIDNNEYANYFSEAVEQWSYMKFPYLTHLGKTKGWNRVGPLARLNICDSVPTPLAQREWEVFRAYTQGRINHHTMHTHWARLIEILHCAELIKELLHDEEIMGDDLLREGKKRHEGIGIIEAPRGTLIHHYEIDEKDQITKCNLIVSTTHNNEAMNQAVRWVAQQELSRKQLITEPMLNQVEIAIRAFDPCLSCATHAMGQMALHLSVYDHQNNLLDERFRN